jgi:hypothetical protein
MEKNQKSKIKNQKEKGKRKNEIESILRTRTERNPAQSASNDHPLPPFLRREIPNKIAPPRGLNRSPNPPIFV